MHVRDITKRKRVEENLRRMATVVRTPTMRSRYRILTGKSPPGTAALTDVWLQRVEALQMSIWRITPRAKMGGEKGRLYKLIAGEAISSFETQRVTKDGRILDVWLTVTKLMDDAGNR